MKAQTGLKIERDIFSFIRSTSVVAGTQTVSGIKGEVYRAGLRPRDSVAEDLVVVFTTADAGQFQQGVVTLNVYVPDILPDANGHTVMDGARCEELEALSRASFDELCALHSDYKFSLRDAIHTVHDDEIHQSFVVVRLGFKYYSL